jgi:copper chaperone CopZ
MPKINFTIIDITCDACIKLSAMALKKMPCVKSVEIKSDGSVTLESEKEIVKEKIIKVLTKIDKTAIFDSDNY